MSLLAVAEKVRTEQHKASADFVLLKQKLQEEFYARLLAGELKDSLKTVLFMRQLVVVLNERIAENLLEYQVTGASVASELIAVWTALKLKFVEIEIIVKKELMSVSQEDYYQAQDLYRGLFEDALEKPVTLLCSLIDSVAN